MAYAYRHKPTIVPYPEFSVADDGQALRAAMKGIGTDEQAIIDILTKRSNGQRQQIAQFFTEEYGRNLIEDLKSELGGKFEKVTIALMLPPLEYLTRQLHKAMKGAGTDEGAVIEILCTRNKTELQKMVDMYETLFDRPLAEHVCSETSGDFRRFLTLLVTGVRDPPGTKNPGKAREEAEKLFQAGEGKLGTDEEVFNKILSHDSYEQLQLVFSEYKTVAGRTIEQGLKSEVSGPLLEAYLAVVEYVQNPVTYFARRLHKAMEGFGSDDTTLIRIIVNHSEDDLQNIKEEYEKLYDRTLESDIKSETSGDYKKALLSILGSP